jgi:hypothetical protein
VDAGVVYLDQSELDGKGIDQVAPIAGPIRRTA